MCYIIVSAFAGHEVVVVTSNYASLQVFILFLGIFFSKTKISDSSYLNGY